MPALFLLADLCALSIREGEDLVDVILELVSQRTGLECTISYVLASKTVVWPCLALLHSCKQRCCLRMSWMRAPVST